MVQGILTLLDSRLDNPRRDNEVLRIPTQLVVRATTRQAPLEDWHQAEALQAGEPI